MVEAWVRSSLLHLCFVGVALEGPVADENVVRARRAPYRVHFTSAGYRARVTPRPSPESPASRDRAFSDLRRSPTR